MDGLVSISSTGRGCTTLMPSATRYSILPITSRNVEAAPRAHHKKQIRIAISSIGDEARPVPFAIVRHQQVVGLGFSGHSSEGTIHVDRDSPRRPGSKCRSTSRNEVSSHWSIRRNVGLRNHGNLSSQQSNQLLDTRN